MDYTAWMIKNDGTEIPVIAHIYADPDETDELLALAYFLWEHDTDSHPVVREFLDVWVYYTLIGKLTSKTLLRDSIVSGVMEYLSSKPYRIFPVDFAAVVADNAGLLYKRFDGVCVDPGTIDGADLVYSLNQRFLRARYGGRYNTVPGCRDMYFRISSVGFDWFPLIREFIKARTDMTETVTIVRDHESTGCEKYYADSGNRPYNKMMLDEFLSGCGSIRLTEEGADNNLTTCVVKALASGAAVEQLLKLPANYGRVYNTIKRLKYMEEAKLGHIRL